jgi:hypothetical protein
MLREDQVTDEQEHDPLFIRDYRITCDKHEMATMLKQVMQQKLAMQLAIQNKKLDKLLKK